MSSMSPIAVIVMCALVVSSDTASTSTASPSQSLNGSRDSSKRTVVTINKCDQRGDRTESHTEWPSDASRNLPDCRCPPDYTAVLQYGEPSQKVLCASLRSAAPWSEGCVSSGSSTDYYDLGAIELRLIRDMLRAANVSEVWISARRIAPFGALVRRLPGDRWNAPVELADPDQSSKEDGHADGQLTVIPTSADFNCAAVGGSNYEQIFLANCSRALPQLCLFRDSTLLQLHCRQREFTTRYGEGQDMCYTVLAKNDRALSALSSPASEYRVFDVDSGRKKQLLDDLLSSMATSQKHCAQTYFTDQRDNPLRSLALSIRGAVQRAFNGTVSSSDTYMGEQSLRQIASLDLWSRYDCTAVQRNNSADHGAGGPVRAMYLYFDRARYRLYLTVYGRQWFWREKPSANGFQCYTNADAEQVRRVQVRPIRTSRKRSRRAHPRSSDGDAPEADDQDTGQRSMYEVTLVDGIPSYYWCEAHLVPNLTHLVSPTVLANRKSNGKTFFSVTVDVRLDRLAETMRLKDYTRVVKDHLKRARVRVLPETKRVLDTIKTVQVMKSDRLRDAYHPDNRTAVRLIVHLVMRQVNFKSDFPVFAEINEIELPDVYVRYYRTRRYLQDALRVAATDEFRFVGLNSTEYCLPDSLQRPSSADGNVWWVARLGETATPRNLCLPEGSDLPLTRRCLGDYLHGCAWDALELQPGQCSSQQRPETRALYEYSAVQLNMSLLPDIFSTVGHVLSAPATVLPVDLFYIAQVLDNLRNVLLLSAPKESALLGALNNVQHYCDMSDIMSSVMYVNETIVTRAQQVLNTTNTLLYVTETIVNQLALAENASVLRQGAQYDCGMRTLERPAPATNGAGTLLFRRPRLIVLIADPAVANVSGVALFRQIDGGGDAEDFNSYTVRYLYANQSVESLVTEQDLEIGAFIPQSVIENLGALHEAMTLEEQPEPETELLEPEPALPPVAPPLRVVLTIYYNDHAFRETRSGPVTRSSAKIISISIPGYGSRMPGEIPFYARETRTNRNRSAATASHCGYWSFETDPAGTEGFGRWAFDECRLIDGAGPVALCGCYHLTSFSRLTMDTQLVESVGVSQKFIADQGTLALDLITAIGCSLSLLGVVGILATGVLFAGWRAKASSKILLQLSCAIAIEMIIIFVDGPDIDQHRVRSHIECALLGSVFHYIILVTFMWMLFTAYLQFMRYVKVLGRLRPSHVILKATVLCWGAPLVPVATYLASDYTLYLKRDNLTDICYPHGDALWFGLMLPIAAIVFFNLVSFVVVLYHICAIPANLSKQTDRDLTLAQLRLSVFLFFLLGLPWIFGMLTTGTEDKLFAYLFCLTAPVQGFVLFLYFIVIDPVARRLWLGRLRRCRCIADRSAANQLDEKETTTLPSTTLNTQL